MRHFIAAPKPKDVDKSNPNFSANILTDLRRGYGSRFMPIFFLYNRAYAYAMGLEVPPEDFAQEVRLMLRPFLTQVSSELEKDNILTALNELMPFLRRIQPGMDIPLETSKKMAEGFQALVSAAARDRNVYLKGRKIHPQGWMYFRKMSPDEAALEKIRLQNPDAYEKTLNVKKIQKGIDKNIENLISDNGLIPSKKRLLGKVVFVGTNPDTGEEVVYDASGDVLPIETYIEKRKDELEVYDRMSKIFPPDLSTLRTVSDEELAAAENEPIEWVSLTDDKAKSKALTRIYPVKRIGSKRIIADGRFKGIMLEDMINAAGRMIEGTAYDFDPLTGRPTALESRVSGSLEVGTVREPYVTIADDGRFYLKIPSTHAYSEVRKNMTELAKVNAAVEKVTGARSSIFYFEPKDFASVRQALGSMAMSEAVTKKIEEYFKTLAKHEMATAKENLPRYSTPVIGGFKPGMDLYSVQKQALAWADSRGGNGVMALGTGVGKTSLALAAMKLDQNRAKEEGRNFKVLFVCPKSLKGNIPSQAYQFLENPRELLDNTVIMTYDQFGKLGEKNPNILDEYSVVFFDEAQELARGTSKAAKAASRPHPRKYFLTASPMEKRPAEVYTLAALSNNEDVTTPLFRKNRLNFEKRFCVEIGGRFVSVKNDPVTQRDMRTWVRRNIFYVDKQNVEEFVLPDLKRIPKSLTMDPEVEAQYRAITNSIKDTMEGLVEKFRDLKSSAKSRAKLVSAARMKLAPQFAQLMTLANLPGKIVPGAKSPKIEEAGNIIEQRIEKGGRTLMFTDMPDLAIETAKQMSLKFPGTRHVAGLSDKIFIYKSGEVEMTFTPRKYNDGNREYSKDEWQTYVMNVYVKPNTFDVVSATFTSAYSKGHNLQVFGTVVHLDRDGWNAEMMQQRTARTWRQGQKSSVEEITLDVTYTEEKSDTDRTLDQIMRYSQDMEEDLFNSIIVASQSQALGREYFEMSHERTSTHTALRRAANLALSPYLETHAQAVELEGNADMYDEPSRQAAEEEQKVYTLIQESIDAENSLELEFGGMALDKDNFYLGK